jgi:hypothetical protein
MSIKVTPERAAIVRSRAFGGVSTEVLYHWPQSRAKRMQGTKSPVEAKESIANPEDQCRAYARVRCSIDTAYVQNVGIAGGCPAQCKARCIPCSGASSESGPRSIPRFAEHEGAENACLSF